MTPPHDKSPSTPDWSGCIVAIARDRDIARVVELFTHFGPMLKGFFIRSGVAPSQAEDIAQDVMLVVWRKAGHFDPARASAATWIFTIARNRRIDLKRQERGQGAREDLNADLANPLPCDNMLSQ